MSSAKAVRPRAARRRGSAGRPAAGPASGVAPGFREANPAFPHPPPTRQALEPGARALACGARGPPPPIPPRRPLKNPCDFAPQPSRLASPGARVRYARAGVRGWAQVQRPRQHHQRRAPRQPRRQGGQATTTAWAKGRACRLPARSARATRPRVRRVHGPPMLRHGHPTPAHPGPDLTHPTPQPPNPQPPNPQATVFIGGMIRAPIHI